MQDRRLTVTGMQDRRLTVIQKWTSFVLMATLSAAAVYQGPEPLGVVDSPACDGHRSLEPSTGAGSDEGVRGLG